MTLPTAAAVAQRLWEQERVDHRSPDAVAAAIDGACIRLRIGIGRWIGAEGYGLLLDRVLVDARVGHAALKELQCRGDDEAGIAKAVHAHGAAQMEKGFLTLVALLVERLGRVVGEDMAGRLVEQSWAAIPSQSSGTQSEGVG